MHTRNILMCQPDYFDVSYDINHWMHDQIGKVNRVRAVSQWYDLCEALSRVSNVSLLNGVKDLPDLVFTANGGFIDGSTAILSRFVTEERQPEEEIFRDWFLKKGYRIIQPTSFYEGEGDHLRDSEGRQWMGFGFRTEKRAVNEISTYLSTKINAIELIDPRWYHLDTCFCPLPKGGVMWYPGAFSEESQSLIRANFSPSIEVTLSDALLFCCNCVCLDDFLFMQGSSEITDKLQALGYNVWEADLSEFIKSGGSAKCLVLDCNYSTLG